MSTHRPTGWNTWDVRGFNRLVYLQEGRCIVTVVAAVWDETLPPLPGARKPGQVLDHLRWGDVTRLGTHAPMGLPAELEFKANGVTYHMAARDLAGTLELTLTPLEETRQRVVFIFSSPINTPVFRESPTTGTFNDCPVELKDATWPIDFFLNHFDPFAVGQPGKAATVRIQAESAAEPPAQEDGYEARALAGTGALADAPQAMIQAVNWNTLYDAQQQLVSSPVSRDWCFDWGGAAVFCWDTFLLATLVRLDSPHLSRFNFEAANAAIDKIGMVPNYYCSHGAASLDRSMPPIGAWLIWKTQLHQPDRAWLDGVYRQLATWHEYWPKYRDGHKNGLFQWGSNREPYYEYPQLCTDIVEIRHCQQAAKWESGLDNSPMFDDVPFNEETCTLELDDVALSSYYAMDCEALAAIADCLGLEEEAQKYRAQYENVKAKINELLWDEENGIYCNRHWDGRLSKRWAPTSFFPLIAGVATQDRAERMVREHLLNEREFWGQWVIPSISRSDPAFPDNDYWRGRIWGPFNFLVAEGLHRYRLDDAAAQLAEKGLELFMRNWRDDGGVYENYNADTGVGGDVWNAARLYHWGGLLVLIAIEELIDVETHGYLRIGSLKFPNAGVQNAHIAGELHDVELNDGVFVSRGGEVWLECDTRAIIRIPIGKRDDRPIEISAEKSGTLTWHGAPQPAPVARINGEKTIEPQGLPAVYRW